MGINKPRHNHFAFKATVNAAIGLFYPAIQRLETAHSHNFPIGNCYCGGFGQSGFHGDNFFRGVDHQLINSLWRT